MGVLATSVDLNPIRAKMAKTPEESKHTCARARIEAYQSKQKTPITIETFVGSGNAEIGLPFKLTDYLELLDWSGRILRTDKRGSISLSTPPILERIDIKDDKWAILTKEFELKFSRWVGSEDITKLTYQAKGYQRIPKAKNYKALFG